MKAALIFSFAILCVATAAANDSIVSLPVKNDTPDLQQLWVYSYAKKVWYTFPLKPGERKIIPFTTGKQFYLVFRNCSQQNQRETHIEKPYDISEVLRQDPTYELSIRQVCCTPTAKRVDESESRIGRRLRRNRQTEPVDDTVTEDVIQWTIRSKR